jgi:hypothetical protein
MITDYRIPAPVRAPRRHGPAAEADARFRLGGVDVHVAVVGDDAHHLVQRARTRLVELASPPAGAELSSDVLEIAAGAVADELTGRGATAVYIRIAATSAQQ